MVKSTMVSFPPRNSEEPTLLRGLSETFLRPLWVGYTVGILQYNPIQSAILRDLIGQFPATKLDYIVVCPQC
jgi:hypothetical protein